MAVLRGGVYYVKKMVTNEGVTFISIKGVTLISIKGNTFISIKGDTFISIKGFWSCKKYILNVSK
jgi:hypothetical protein